MGWFVGWFLNQDDLTVKVITPSASLHSTSVQTAWIPELLKGDINISSFDLQEEKWKGILVLQVQTSNEVNSLIACIETYAHKNLDLIMLHIMFS